MSLYNCYNAFTVDEVRSSDFIPAWVYEVTSHTEEELEHFIDDLGIGLLVNEEQKYCVLNEFVATTHERMGHKSHDLPIGIRSTTYSTFDLLIYSSVDAEKITLLQLQC